MLPTIANASQTMSSMEISELTGKQHAHVMRDIRNMLALLHGEEGVSNFGDTYTNPQNSQVYAIFKLPKDETLCLMAGYDVKARMTIIKRWQELESAKPKELSRKDLALMIIDAENEIERLALVVETQAPKVVALERIAQSSHEHNMRDGAKVLQIRPGTMSGWLKSLGWVSKGQGKHWFAIQTAINAGLMTMRENEQELEDGSVKIRPQAMITPKGMAKLAVMLSHNPNANNEGEN